MNTVPNFKRREESGSLNSFKTTVKDTRTRKTSDILDKRRTSDGIVKLGEPLPLSYAVKMESDMPVMAQTRRSTRRAWRTEELRAFQKGRSEDMPVMSLQERRERLLEIRQKLCAPVDPKPDEHKREIKVEKPRIRTRTPRELQIPIKKETEEWRPSTPAPESHPNKAGEVSKSRFKQIQESSQLAVREYSWTRIRLVMNTILVLALFCWWSYLVSD